MDSDIAKAVTYLLITSIFRFSYLIGRGKSSFELLATTLNLCSTSSALAAYNLHVAVALFGHQVITT